MARAAIRKLSQWCVLPFASVLLFRIELCAQSTYREIDVSNGGTIMGRVVLNPSGVRGPSFNVTKDSEHCGLVKNSDRLVVGKNGAIKGAIVSIVQITQGKKFDKFPKPVLDQRKCEYVPHVQVLPVGTPFDIVNSDDILHNVHAYVGEQAARTVFNIAQPIKGQKTTINQSQLSRPGLLYLTCDAGHPWMTAYVLLTEHPYYAVTDEHGRFELANVPPGNYQVKMWKEGFRVIGTEVENEKVKKYHFEEPYEETRDVSIKANQKVDIEFQLVPRGQS